MVVPAERSAIKERASSFSSSLLAKPLSCKLSISDMPARLNSLSGVDERMFSTVAPSPAAVRNSRPAFGSIRCVMLPRERAVAMFSTPEPTPPPAAAALLGVLSAPAGASPATPPSFI